MGAALGSFELGREVARGRSSVVVSGKGPRAETAQVAVKLLRPGSGEERSSFVARARLAAGIQHRNVVKTLEVLEGPDQVGWVMEHLDGAPLAELDPAAATPSLALRILADALAGLHEVHRKTGKAVGLDAGRVMLTGDGRVKLLLSRLGEGEDPSADLVSAGALLRTLLGDAAPPPEVRTLVEKIVEGRAFPTAHALRVAVEQCATGLRPPATPASLAAFASTRRSTSPARVPSSPGSSPRAIPRAAPSRPTPTRPVVVRPIAGRVASRSRPELPSVAPRDELEPTNPSYPSAEEVARADAAAQRDDDEPTLARPSPRSLVSAMEVAAAFGAVLDEDLDFAIDAAFDSAFTPSAPVAQAPVAQAPVAPAAAPSTPPTFEAPELAEMPSPREDTEKIPRRPPQETTAKLDVAEQPPEHGLSASTAALPFPVQVPAEVPRAPAPPVAPAAEDPELDAIATPARLRALAPAARPSKPPGMAAPAADAGFWPSLRHRNFALFMACFLIANSGARMQTATLTWLIFKRTNDPIYLGWLGLAFALPMILLAPIGGILADRVERVRLVRAVKALSAVLSIGLVLVHRAHLLGVGPILAVQALSAVLLAFEHPTRLSLVPDYVPRKHLQNALAVNGIVNFATVFAGPALTGWLLEPRGAGFIFVAAAVASVLGIGLLTFVSASPPRVARSEKLRELFFGGIKHVRGDSPVVALLVLATIVGVSARTYPELLPIFAQRSWGAGAKGYGTLASASGIGGMLSVLALSFSPNLKGKDVILVGSVAGLCASLVAFTFMRSLNMAALILVLAGAFATVFQNLGTNFIAARVPPAVLGRVLGLYTITLFGVPGFGMVALTAVARKTTGALALLVAVAISFVALLATAYPLTRRKPPPGRR